jgi:DNA-binding NarL/FixJ family response regulator
VVSPLASFRRALRVTVPCENQTAFSLCKEPSMVRLSPNLAPKDGAPTIRVLVVEDYAPFLQYIVSLLAQTDDLQVICEASDGLEAVHGAEELKPDLILLDIGLPTLNGIEAARQIRQLCPESKIIFVSQESDADIVQEALSFGALGYVVKTMAGVELLTAIKAVCRGRLFVGGLSSPCSC